MPFLDEKMEPIHTVKSIYDTAPSDLFEIIAIDDCSRKSKGDPDYMAEYFNVFPDVTYLRTDRREGVDYCRQWGSELAKTPNLFIIDAHMRFKDDNWLQKLIACLEREPETLWCTTCLGLGYGNMDINRYKGKYYGATMLFYDKKAPKDRPAREVMEPKWYPFQNKSEYELPCVLGANYGVSKQWFDHIGGLRGLKMWGSSEPFMSLKTWMAGGKCKINTDIEVGHKFRNNAPYSTEVLHLVYNKIFMCKTIIPEDIAERLMALMAHDVNYVKAMKNIKKNEESVVKDREYYDSIFKMSLVDYCEKFNIALS